MFLSEMKENSCGVITSVKVDSEFARRLRDMGFCEGESVRCVRQAAMKSPILYYVKGSYIALRRSDAKRIGVAL